MRLKLFFFPTALLITVVMFIWYIYPLWQGKGGISDQHKKLKETKQTLETFRAKKTSLNQAVEMLDNHNDDVKFAFQFIPLKSNDLFILNSLSQIADQSGLILNSINVSEEKKSNKKEQSEKNKTVDVLNDMNWRSAVASVNVIGSYEQVKSFLTSLYHLDRYNQIDSLDIETNNKSENANENENQANLLTFNAKINFRYLPDALIPVEGEEKFLDNFQFSENYFNFLAINSLKEKNNIQSQGGGLEEGITGQITNPFTPFSSNTVNVASANNTSN